MQIHLTHIKVFGNPAIPDGHRSPYPTRHLATLRESELLPAFTGPYTGWTRLSGTRTGQDSIAVQNLSVWRLPMFLLNSQDPLVTATCNPSLAAKAAGTPYP